MTDNVWWQIFLTFLTDNMRWCGVIDHVDEICILNFQNSKLKKLETNWPHTILINIFGADMSQSFLRKVLLTDNVRWHSDWVNFCLLWRSKLILKYELVHFGVTEWHAILVQKSELLHIWRSHLTRISQPKLLSLLSDSLWFIYIFGADMGDWSPASTGIDCSSSKLFLNVMRWCDCPCRI